MCISNVSRRRIGCALMRAVLLCIASFVAAQEGAYAQGSLPQHGLYAFNTHIVNPACAGGREQWYAQMYYNNYWLRSGTPAYFHLAADGSISRKANAGAYFEHESAGLAQSARFAVSYAYRIYLSERSDISMGLSMGGIHNSIDYDGVRAASPEDPSLLTLANTAEPLIDIGVHYQSEALQAGITLRRLAGNSVKDPSAALLQPERRSMVLTAGTLFRASETVDVLPSLLWQENLVTSSSLAFSLAMVYKYDYRAGVSLRTEQPLWKKPTEAVPLLTASYRLAFSAEAYWRRFTFGYTYSLGLTSFVSGYVNEHALSVGYYLSYNVPHRHRIFHFWRYNDYCPSCYEQR